MVNYRSTKSTEVEIGVLQFKPEFLNVESNLLRIIDMVKDFHGDLLVLPELVFSGYLFKEKEELVKASNMNDVIFDEMIKLSISKDLIIVFGFVEKCEDYFYNSCAVVLPNGGKYIYRKSHLFYKEKLLFHPGDTGFFVIDFEDLRVGPAICFDWFFSESFKTLSILGADIIAHCANLVMPYCQNASIYRAIENKVYIATANRWGKESNDGEELEFTGMSQIVSPDGKILVRAGKKEDVIISTVVNLNTSRDKRLNEYNDILKDRREDIYFKGRVYKEA